MDSNKDTLTMRDSSSHSDRCVVGCEGAIAARFPSEKRSGNRSMNILMCHNYYQQRGGEDQCFEDECRMLRDGGQHVVEYVRHNDDINEMSKVRVAVDTIWSRKSTRDLTRLFEDRKIDLVHVTNSFPLISPAIYFVAAKFHVPVVQALHNYRLLCPAGTFFRDGKVCEDCVGKCTAWPAVQHKCYRGSRLGSATISGMLATHRALGTWRNKVTRYFTLTDFARQKFVENGLPAERIDVKPNCVSPDPGIGLGDEGHAVFVGRLSQEKGIDLLLETWRSMRRPLKLKIIGDGPCLPKVQQAADQDPRIEVAGHLSLDQVCDEVGKASFLVMPSVWYETFGRTIIEAYAAGTPVIATDMGAMREIVVDGVTGLKFKRADANDLREKIDDLLADPARLQKMRINARLEYEQKYTSQHAYSSLIGVYEKALAAPPV